MRTIILGGSGYVGSHLAQAMRQQGWEVTSVHRRPQAPYLDEMGVESVNCDLSQPDSLLEMGLDPWEFDLLIQAVSLFGEPMRDSVTVIAAQQAVKFAELNPGMLVVDLSSVAVYAGLPGGPFGEEAVGDTFSPIPHVENKRRAEEWIRSCPRWLILRLGMVFGDYEGLPASSFNRVFLDGLLRGILPIVGGGRNVISLVHVEDAVRAVLFLIENGEVHNQTFNVACRDYISTAALLTYLAEHLKAPAPRRFPYLAALLYAYVEERLARIQGREPEVVPDFVQILSSEMGVRTDLLGSLGFSWGHPRTLEALDGAYGPVFSEQQRLRVPTWMISKIRGLS